MPCSAQAAPPFPPPEGARGWRYFPAALVDDPAWSQAKYRDDSWALGTAPFRMDRSFRDAVSALFGKNEGTEAGKKERALYFASEYDPRYEPVFESHDPGDKPQLGGTIYARYGKGVYIFTSYSWFRQLPAGVPGAIRLFVNLISAGHASK